MKSVSKWMLGAAVAVGALGLAATPAKAQQFGIYVGSGPAAYVPPCPGPGYTWVAGYYADGYWMPGRWAYVGVRDWDGDDYPRYYRDRDDWRDGDGWRGREGWRGRDGWRGNDGWRDRGDHFRDHGRGRDRH